MTASEVSPETGQRTAPERTASEPTAVAAPAPRGAAALGTGRRNLPGLPLVQRHLLRPGVGRRRGDRAAGAHALRGRA